MDKARALSQQHRCNFCHQANYAGQENVPRLAGQREDYLLKALRGYKDNSRRGYDAQMSEVVYDLKDEDFVELAYSSPGRSDAHSSARRSPPATARPGARPPRSGN